MEPTSHPRLTALVAALGLAVLVAGALVPLARPVAALVLVAGWLGLRAARHPATIAWAAAISVSVALVAPVALGPDVPLGAPACVDPLSAIVVRRVATAVIVLGVVALLARAHASDARELCIRRPRRVEVVLASAGCVIVAAGGLVIGPWLARPFFGTLDFPVPPAAILPAVIFGVANGAMEEVQYRGAMQGWLGRIVPRWAAIAYPALVFGVVHAGPEVVALLPVHVAALAAVGLAAGLVRNRTGSLAIPIGVHVGADIALYVGLACRAAA